MEEMMSKILVVEDEVGIARFVELELIHEGYEVEIANNGRLGLERILSDEFDLVILDVMLPLLSGFEVCRRARQENRNLPIIMLTAKDDVADKVSGLDIGADDYMTKPFSIEELLARIRVAIKRSKKMKLQDTNMDIIKVGPVTLNISSYSAFYENDELSLTKKEFELLEYLMRNKNSAVKRETLLNEVWDYEYLGDTNVVDVYIRYLRQKIDDKYGVKFINTVRGIGYIIKD